MPSLRVLLACDKFKTCLTADEANEAVAEGLRRGLARINPKVEIEFRRASIADGGEGFAAGIVNSPRSHGSWHNCVAHDALHRRIPCRFGLISVPSRLAPKGPPHRVAVLEMAESAGYWRISESEHDPLRSSTRGVGEMLRAAAALDPTEIWLGIGGSATNDGGAGMAAALGWRFLDEHGKELEPVPAELIHCRRAVPPEEFDFPLVRAACDVTNPLLGPLGATPVYGPQKGVRSEEIATCEAALSRLLEARGRPELALEPGSGAAGGLGFGLVAFADAILQPGFELYAEATGLLEDLEWANLIITGEGSLDGQSLNGKGPVALTRLARERSKPCHAVCGRLDLAVAGSAEFASCHSVAEAWPEYTIEEMIERSEELLRRLAEERLCPAIARTPRAANQSCSRVEST